MTNSTSNSTSTQTYIGSRKCPEGLRFELLEIKSEFVWKMKSRKIQRLELLLGEIEAGDSKRKNMCICPSQRNTVLVEFHHGRAAMAGLELHGWPCWARQRGKGGGWRGAGRVGALAGCMGCSALLFVFSVADVWARREGEEREKEKKKGKGKEKEKKWKNLPNQKISGEKNKTQFIGLV
jgi:hypothetical protein